MARSIGDISKRNPVSVRASDDIIAAAQLMREKHIGYLVVVEPEPADQTLRPVGVLTDRDIVVAVVAKDVNPRSLAVGDVMTAKPIVVSQDSPIGTALAEMRRIGVRRLPVVGWRGELVGVVSMDDLLETLATELSDLSGSIRTERRIEGALRP